MNDKQTINNNVANIFTHFSEVEKSFILGYMAAIKMAAEGADKSHV